MEETEQNLSPEPEVVEKNTFIKKATTGKSFLFIFVIVGVIALGAGLFKYNEFRNERKEKSRENQVVKQFVSNNVMVYGYWVGDQAVIALHSLKDGTTGTAATLPSNIKHVKIISPTALFYIADTDERDHGKTINSKNLQTGAETTVFTADEGFGIDDYALSPNGKYISVWQVKMPADAETLTNGISRVYTYDVSSQIKYLIYDEAFGIATSVHYPIGITDTGDLYTDRFLSNSGEGWAFGMSKSDLTGTQKSDIASMDNGTYSSQPVISPNGKYIAFAGYSGIDGKQQEASGRRKAIENPNTVEILDLQNDQRYVIKEASGKMLYPSVIWDKVSGNLFFVEALIDGENFSFSQFSYNPLTRLAKTVISSQNPDGNEKGIAYASLSDTSYLLGKKEAEGEFMGNLGDKYTRSFRSLTVWKEKEQKYVDINLINSPLQLITVTKGTFFPEGLIKYFSERSSDQLQLGTFAIKQDLASKRELQQSNRRPNPTVPPPVAIDPGVPTGIPQQSCVGGREYENAAQCYGDRCGEFLLKQCYGNVACEERTREDFVNTDGTCSDSPLYLYGEEGQRVSVQVGVPLYDPNIPYSPESGVDVTISSDGLFYANGKLINGFSFDYSPGIKRIERPEYGVVIPGSDLQKTLKKFGEKLGLNEKEILDLRSEAKKISSNYIYLSFFDHLTSKKILPLYFSPKPDTYRNIVFYIEKFDARPDIHPQKPAFNPIVRLGLTAIETSLFVR